MKASQVESIVAAIAATERALNAAQSRAKGWNPKTCVRLSAELERLRRKLKEQM